jgi:predicted chitinase
MEPLSYSLDDLRKGFPGRMLPLASAKRFAKHILIALHHLHQDAQIVYGGRLYCPMFFRVPSG